MLNKVDYNPDVLTCLANLSNDEVFTPPKVANQVLDMLPQDIFEDKDCTFLDPATKSGVFLREIAKRLMVGLEDEIPDEQERVNHILTKQLFGLALTELTALLSRRSVYCSKDAAGEYSVCDSFSDEGGNILLKDTQHQWEKGKCKHCGASQSQYERDSQLETHAYQFLHTENPEELFNMKFDVIIGNPPYQLSDGGHGTSSKPIYQKFVEQAKKLEPRFLSMIIPSRWFAGGKGLDDFREEMLNDSRIRKLVDFENVSEVFPGIDLAGGVCFFLWSRDEQGECEVVTREGDEEFISVRSLNEFPLFIRNGKAIPVIRKVMNSLKAGDRCLNEIVSPRKPFGIPTNYVPRDSGVPFWFIQKIGLRGVAEEDMKDRMNLRDKWKLLIPKAPIAGQTDFSKPVGFYYDGNVRIARPGECCTESWLVACSFGTKAEVVSFKSYLFTKTVRFLLLQTVVSQDVTRGKFCFVPYLNSYDRTYDDDFLRNLWGITDEEWEFIDSRVKTIEEGDGQ